MRAIVVIPTYNERENLPLLVQQIYQHVNDLHILIVDDNSPDGTGELAEELGREHAGKIFVLHRLKKGGLGKAYVAGFRWALERNYDVILQMDADLSHQPCYLPALLDRIRTCDVALGSRYVRGINVVNWDFKRLLLSKMASLYVRVVTRMPVSDATGGFKCWRSSTLDRLDLAKVFANGYLFQVETTYRAYRQGLKVDEVPIVFYERDLGRSKMDWHIVWEALWGVLKLRIEPLLPGKPKTCKKTAVMKPHSETAA